jgi:hypothetical protein
MTTQQELEDMFDKYADYEPIGDEGWNGWQFDDESRGDFLTALSALIERERKEAIKLTKEQCEGIMKLINDEKRVNEANGDEAYNTFWDNIIKALEASCTK